MSTTPAQPTQPAREYRVNPGSLRSESCLPRASGDFDAFLCTEAAILRASGRELAGIVRVELTASGKSLTVRFPDGTQKRVRTTLAPTDDAVTSLALRAFHHTNGEQSQHRGVGHVVAWFTSGVVEVWRYNETDGRVLRTIRGPSSIPPVRGLPFDYALGKVWFHHLNG